MSRKTVQRWESGERAPDPGAEVAILRHCRERDLFRVFALGPFANLGIDAESLEGLLAEARWGAGSMQLQVGPAEDGLPAREADSGPDDPAGAGGGRSCLDLASNLPASLTSFVGREREISEVRRLQARTRLLTLTGAPGCGKTRLALALADELLWAYPNGVWLVDLASLSEERLVTQTVAATLAVPATDAEPLLEAAKRFLRTRSLLLVLDNCEHLLAACAELVEALLRACPSLEVLATSREPLGIGGEVLWQVPPLALVGSPAAAGEPSEAIRLFVERRRLHRPDFELTPQNSTAVADVCRWLEGIPLAIELAARVKVLSTEQMAVRRGNRLELLTGGARTAPPRHQTLRAALDWSHDLLTPSEQALLRRLSVIDGAFTLGAAAAVYRGAPGGGDAVVADAAEALALLARLVDKSLVTATEVGGFVRYRMLETVREHAAEKLIAAAEDVETHTRYAAWRLAPFEGADADA